MIIGIDFDNTIVCYDDVYKEIVARGSIVPVDTPPNKYQVKKYLIDNGLESKWTELQGEIYGPLMKYAKPFTYVNQFIEEQINLNHQILIISHRTLHPILGKKYNLHETAKEWIHVNLKKQHVDLISSNNIFFNTTKEEKINKIQESQCNYFIDDLPEILDLIKTNSVKKILFTPNVQVHTDHVTAKTWKEISNLINDKQL